jgi:S-formylglutathione hydrolase FrmB
MAFIQCELKSESLQAETSLAVILPHDKPNKPGCRGVLYLLHGRGQNAQSWTRFTSIEYYANKYDIAVIMPEAGRSFYTDKRYGGAYFTWVTKELPELCGRMFHITNDPQTTYIAGLSMGGYGALKCALNYPGQYAGCGSFSAVTDIRWRLAETPKTSPNYRSLQAVFGVDPEPQAGEDLFEIAGAAARAPRRPRLMITCGLEDVRLEQNRRLSALLKEQGYEHEYQEWTGLHDWDFWDTSRKKALVFFCESRSTE